MSRTTTVPAQITTVEDKIVGSLGLTQVILLSLAAVSSGLIFLMLTPANKITAFKVSLLVITNVLLVSSALRYRGDLLFRWAIVGLRYAARPRYWVFDKRTTYMRPVATTPTQSPVNSEKTVRADKEITPLPLLDTPTKVRVEQLNRKNVKYINTRGGLKIVFTSETE